MIHPRNLRARTCRAGILMMVWLGMAVAVASAQRSQLPQSGYYIGFREFYLADYKDAERFYSRGASTTFQFGTRKFLDSVCYWTMMGECYYHMGNYAQAVEMYEQSLRLYLTYQAENWQARIQLPPSIQADDTAVAQARITWGTPTRRFRVARLPDTYQVLFGRLDADRVLQEGGVVQNAEIKQVDLNEIFRCLALSLHRRRVIKGPTTKFDPLTGQLARGLAAGPMGDGTILGAYNGVLLGIVQASLDEWDQATGLLKRSLQIAGQLDHPLTPVALVELSQIGLETGNDAVAQQLGLEASYSAAVFNQFDLVEEGLSVATTAFLKDARGAYPPLELAAGWANRNDARRLQASMIIRLAECLSEAGDVASSERVLREVNRAISNRNTLSKAVVTARLKYVTALNLFLAGDFANGMSNLTAALAHFQNGSLWLYRLGLADQLAINGVITPRQADQLYTVLLRDPEELDWKLDPMEAIAFLATPHVGAMERWFELAVGRRDYKRALEIGELVRRHRFFASLPLGGRLMAFRWVMQAPVEALSETAQTQRSQFLNSNPTFNAASERSRQLTEQLRALPVQPDAGSDEARQQQAALEELGKVSAVQEAMLASHALRRQPAELAFPPGRSLADLQTAIAPDQVALVTLATASGYHFFAVTEEAARHISSTSGRDVERAVSALSRALNLGEPALEPEQFQDQQWREVAQELGGQFFPDVTDEQWEKIREVVIIPDGVLWYLPFEALPVGGGDPVPFLSQRVEVRYAPTLGLAFGAQRPASTGQRRAVVTGRMHARGDVAWVGEQFDELLKLLPETTRFEQLRYSPNTLGVAMDQLAVWTQIDPVKGQPYAQSVTQVEAGRVDGTLAAWMSLPWQGPVDIVLPGYQAEGLTRGQAKGREMFFTTMGLLASGARTILISRWNTGGQTGLQLSTDYLAKMEELGAGPALLAARAAVRERDLDYSREPRLRTKPDDPVAKAEHPFFWSGPMLIGVPSAGDAAIQPRVDPGKSEVPGLGADPAAGGKPPEGGMLPGAAPQPGENKQEAAGGGGKAEGNEEAAGGGEPPEKGGLPEAGGGAPTVTGNRLPAVLPGQSAGG